MRNKVIAILFCLAGSLLLSHSASASEYMFTYSKLYTQLKHNAMEGHPDVRVAIFFTDADTKKVCRIEKAWMEKEEHYEEFIIPANQELPLPLDNNLKQANPLIFVRTPQDQRCDYSLVVMSRESLSGRVEYGQIETLLPQMQSLLEELGGMFASWFTPDVEGLTLEFPAGTQGRVVLSNGAEIAIENNRAQILLTDLKPNQYLELPAETLRVLPWLPSAK